MLKPATEDAYRLLHNGSLALARMEGAGMRVDMDYLNRAHKYITNKISRLETELKEDQVYKTWQKEFGGRTNLGSRTQLAKIIYGVMGYPCYEKTSTGRPKADEAVFEYVDLPFVKKYVRAAKYKKLKTTYLEGLKAEAVERSGVWFIHPFFNLHTVISYRSSCSEPNFQNIPARDPEIAKIIRRCFIARDGHQIGEADFKGSEVCLAAAITKDPVLIEYVCDKTKDMHRDMVMKCFKLRQDQVNKATRQAVKASFVFAEFYGDYYIKVARHLWEDVDRENLTLTDGTSLRDHLTKEGFTELGACDPDNPPRNGTFEWWVKKQEDYFWNTQFKVYTAWKKRSWEAYQREGGLNTHTGFRIEGVFRRNQILNIDIQGSSFHCDLWVLIQLDKWLRKNKMKTRLISEVHDSIVADIYIPEMSDYFGKVKELVTVDLRKHWSWITVPMTVEVEVAPPGKSWYDKKGVEL